MIVVEQLTTDLVLVKLDRPEKRNALTSASIEELAVELRRAGDNEAVRGVVLAGSGPAFCTGVDLHEFAMGSAESVRRLIGGLRDVCSIVRSMPKPVACAVQGYCLGGALEIAACCDFRVATRSAQLGMPEVFLGIPSVIDAVMLGHHVGVGRARELLLTGDPIDGETALQWGLVNRLAPQEELIGTAVELLVRVTRHNRAVVAGQKRLHQEWLELPYEQSVERSIEPLLEAMRSGLPQRIAAERLGG